MQQPTILNYIFSNFQQPPPVAMQYEELTEVFYIASLLKFLA